MIEHARATLLYHFLASAPLLTFLAFLLAVKVFRVHKVQLPWKTLTVLLLALLGVAAAAYPFLPIILDDAESGLAGASALALRGLPIYPDPLGAAHYGLLYGPVASLWHIPFYYIFGPNLFSFKLAGVLAFFASLLGTYRICRHYADRPSSLVGLGFAAVVLFQYAGYDFWGRSDPLILLLCVATIWVALSGPVWAVLAVTCVAVGALPNLKISAAAYVLPVLGFVAMRRGWRIAIAATALGLGVFALPFALPQVSLSNYIYLLEVVSRQGFSIDFLSRNVQYCLILLAPLLLLRRDNSNGFPEISRDQWRYFGLIVAAMVATCVLGSKVGAGNYHLIPYLVPVLHLYFWRRADLPQVARDLRIGGLGIAWAATLLFYSTTHVRDLASGYLFSRVGSVAVSEIRQVESKYKGQSVEVGSGQRMDSLLVSYGPWPVFDGQPYTLNLQSVRDTQMGGANLPDATIRYILACRTQIWLIPRNETPFLAGNAYYTTDHPAFDDNFRQAFARTYKKTESLNVFDVWSCEAGR